MDIQNGTLAITITAGLLKKTGMAVPVAVYNLLMYVTGFGFILYGKQSIDSVIQQKYGMNPQRETIEPHIVVL